MSGFILGGGEREGKVRKEGRREGKGWGRKASGPLLRGPMRTVRGRERNGSLDEWVYSWGEGSVRPPSVSSNADQGGVRERTDRHQRRRASASGRWAERPSRGMQRGPRATGMWDALGWPVESLGRSVLIKHFKFNQFMEKS